MFFMIFSIVTLGIPFAVVAVGSTILAEKHPKAKKKIWLIAVILLIVLTTVWIKLFLHKK